MTASPSLDAVLARIDAANALDPEREADGESDAPAALLYGQRMSRVLESFVAAPSDALRIAVRAQHIERWKRPRQDYPEGRAGYLRWRRDASAFHAERAVTIMAECGWDEAARERVASIIRKERLKADPETQALEDVACLVFMRWYFVPFAASRPEEELARIVAKTARKMSPAGRQAALALPLPPAFARLVAELD